MNYTMCVNCGREVTYKNGSLSLFEVNTRAKCCSNPSLRWITRGEFSKNTLHKRHVENTKRNNVNQD